MQVKKYKIIDEFDNVVADKMDIEVAVLLMRAYCQEYYTDKINLTLKEEEKVEEEIEQY